MTRPYPERIGSYLQDVLDSAVLLQSYLRPYAWEEFASDEAPAIQLTLVRDSVVRRLEIIGQALHNIQTADPEYVKRHQLDVCSWYGLRSKISHGYEDLDYRLLWGVVRFDLPALVAQVRHCLDLDGPVARINRRHLPRGRSR